MRQTEFFQLLVLLYLQLIVLTNDVFAQENKPGLISVKHDDATFGELVQTIESQTSYYFYFNPTQLDSVSVNLDVKNSSLESILDQVFKDSEFNYAIDKSNNVFVTKGIKITTSLPVGFFNTNIPKEKELDVPDFIPMKETEKAVLTLENRLIEIGDKSKGNLEGNISLAGKILDIETGEPVIGASILIEKPQVGAVTDMFGYYSLNIPRGRNELIIKSIGFKDTKRQVMVFSDGKLDIEVKPDVVSLKEVVIEAEKKVNLSGVQMGREKLDIKTIKQMPSVLGESDLIRVVLTLPGVKSVGEGTTGFNVRGGSTDQNLILFNDATVYNPSHLFGFFSAFNPDVIKNVELYKSSIPAKYGGRLSSVLDVTTREGNKKKFAGSGGIGVVTGRLTLEGPIIKNRTSFIVGARSTYSDWLLKTIQKPEFKNITGSFYDANLHVNHEFDENNTLYVTGYYSNDKFRLRSDTLYKYSNLNGVIKFKHIFNNKFISVFTASNSNYSYSVSSDQNPVNSYDLTFGINQSSFKGDFTYFLNSNHALDFGINSNFYNVNLGSFLPLGNESLVKKDVLERENALESAIYLADKFDISPVFSLNFGVRYSLYSFLGPQEVIQYRNGVEKNENSMIDTISYRRGKFIQNYHGPEFRASARYLISANSSIKLGYNSLRQYLHMLSNTTAISPTDSWKLSDPNIKPQLGSQISLGLYKNLKSNTVETSVEIYYKRLSNFLDYKSGAVLLMNHTIETDVISTQGKAYGAEFMLKKLTGKLNGWISYTFSRTLLRMNDPAIGEKINGGNYYPSNFDKPHDITLIGNYKFTHRFSVSLNMTYSTGRPITIPIGKYNLNGSERILYSDRNQYRIPDYFRTDLAINIEGNHKVKKLSHSSWTIAVYNLTGRRNAYSIYFKSEGNQIKGYKLSIFGQPIPTVTYNFKF